MAAAGHELFVAYFPATQERVAATMEGLEPNRAYVARWVNPRTGAETALGALAAGHNPARWRVPPRPDANDWVLVVNGSAHEHERGTHSGR